MSDLARLESQLSSTLHLTHRPVAIAFRDAPPAGIEPFVGSQPSSCSVWRLAAAGRTFYTVPSDHYNCPVGAYTHNIPLPDDRAAELTQTLSFMADIGYIRMEEVPGVPRLPRTPAVAVYAPLGAMPVAPDVVVISGQPGRLMLLQEAVLRAAKPSQPVLGRPTCMAIPAALPGGMASSFGCIGNRVYTEVGDDELYVVIAGTDLKAVVGELTTIAAANATLAGFHRDRRGALTSA